MDYNKILPNPYIGELKCSLCDNFLSYFPIYITNKSQNVCGRCKVPEDEAYVENEILQIVTENLQFPCRYVDNGCIAKLTPKRMKKHEKICEFRVILCPGSEINICHEEVPIADLVTHCQNNHANIILQEGYFEINLKKSEQTYNIMILNNNIYIFKKLYSMETNSFSSVCYMYDKNSTSSQVWYKISLKGAFRKLSITATFCRNFETSDCKNVSLNILTGDSIYYLKGKIKLAYSVETRKEVETDTDLRRLFICLNCTKVIDPQVGIIFNENNSFCRYCGLKQGYKDFRDTRLNKIASKLLYPCQNASEGCTFQAHPLALANHTSKCSFQIIRCILLHYAECNWMGANKYLVSHILNEHGEFFAKESELQFDVNRRFDKLIIIKFSTYLFTLNIQVIDKFLKWNIQMINEFMEGVNYELEVVSNLNKKKSVIKTGICLPFKLWNQQFQSCDFLDLDQLQPIQTFLVKCRFFV